MRLRHTVAFPALAAAVAGLLAPAARLRAQSPMYPGLTAVFRDRAGTAGPTDPIDVWVRLTLAPDAPALRFDAFSPATNYGLPAGFLPTTGRAPDGSTGTFTAYRSLQTGVGLGCPNAFGPPVGVETGPCVPAPYRFAFNTATFGPTFQYLRRFTLLPGGTFDFLMGTFLPQGGSAPVGVYEFDRALPLITVFGVDASGRDLIGSAVLTETCPVARGPDCGFVRTVVGAAVVPEPRPGVLAAAGLAGLAMLGAAKRRRAGSAPGRCAGAAGS